MTLKCISSSLITLGFISSLLFATPTIGKDSERQTYKQAMAWYAEAAESGDTKAQFYYGIALEEGLLGKPDSKNSLIWFQRAAAGGFPLAQHKLGVMFQLGKGVAPNAVKARLLYERASKNGIMEAKYNLAAMLQNGEGGSSMPLESALLFEETARDGIAISFLQLSILFTQGRGIKKNLKEALKWSVLAERAQIKGAREVSDSLRSQMTSTDISHAESMAKTWR